MKSSTKFVVAAASVGLASSAALADFDPALDVVLDLGTFTLVADPDGNPTPVEFNVVGPADVVGFSFSGTASGVSGNSTWASDTRLSVLVNGDEVFNIGGLLARDNDWDFQGSASTNDGPYASGPHLPAAGNPVPAGVDWTFSFFHNWNSTFAADITWTDAQLTVHRIPAPGALALLGLGGLAAARRRR